MATELPPASDHPLHFRYVILGLLILLIIVGNALVILAVFMDKKLRSAATNKFIASLAVSDLLVGAIVMPLALYVKVNDDKWQLGLWWCQFHLMTAVFSTTASIVHLVAISLDRYFAIIFPTEYQRHSLSTSASPYVIMIWFMSLAISCTSFLEEIDIESPNSPQVCWIEDPQYLILSSLLAFFLPAATIIYLYGKIFRKLRRHLFLFSVLERRGQYRTHAPPQVIVEEVRSRRGSRVDSQGSGSRANSFSNSTGSVRQEVTVPAVRYRSPTICTDTLDGANGSVQNQDHRLSTHSAQLHPEPKLEVAQLHEVKKEDCERSRFAKKRAKTAPNKLYLSVPTVNTPPVTPTKPSAVEAPVKIAKTPSSNASPRSSVTTNSSDDFDRRSSAFSFASTLTDSDLENDSRRPSSLSDVGDRRLSYITEENDSALKLNSTPRSSKGKLRRIAAQVTRAVRRKRRESLAIRRETRATRLVAAILIAFILCWLPYFCVTVYRGVCIGTQCSYGRAELQVQAYLITSWLGYIHSCFNPLIYTCLNKSFRKTLKRLITCRLTNAYVHRC